MKAPVGYSEIHMAKAPAIVKEFFAHLGGDGVVARRANYKRVSVAGSISPTEPVYVDRGVRVVQRGWYYTALHSADNTAIILDD